MKSHTIPERPFLRIFSQKKQKFTAGQLQNSNFDDVFFDNDASTAYNKFITIVQSAFEHSFPFTRLSRAMCP